MLQSAAMATPIGAQEIADLLDVQDRTVHQWIRRGLMPPPKWQTVNGSRAWDRRDVLKWAGQTGRLTDPDLIAEYVAAVGAEPRPLRKGGRLPPDAVPRRRRASS